MGTYSGARTAWSSGAIEFYRGVRVTQSLVFFVIFCRSLSFCNFSFGNCIVCPSMYGF